MQVVWSTWSGSPALATWRLPLGLPQSPTQLAHRVPVTPSPTSIPHSCCRLTVTGLNKAGFRPQSQMLTRDSHHALHSPPS